MSQVGTVVSCNSWSWCGQVFNYFCVDFTYQLDSGTTGRSRVLVGPGGGNGVTVQVGGSDLPILPTSTPWTSPSSTITVNPPGTTNPVVLTCPPLVQAATFGSALK